jgi:type I restriction enzyme S subunit
MSTATLHSEKKKALIPKLRFSGFDKNWETITLGDLLTFKNGLNSDKEKYGKGVKFINVLDILNNDFITYDKIIGSVEVTEKEFEKNEVSYGDILFQRSSETRAEVGQANVYLDRNKSSVFGGFVIRGKAKSEYEPLFMNYLLRTPIARKEITDKSGGSTRYNVGQDTLSKVQLTTTIISEQQKIASFLSAVDEKIQQLSRKKELLEQYKKGVMQQLFSGKLRFKDEKGEDYADWEEKKLGDVGNIITGKTPSTTDSNLWNGDIQFITPTDIKDGIKYQESTERYVVDNDKIKILPSNSIIYTCIASIGKMCISKFPCITNQQINSLLVHQDCNFEYVYYWLFYITPYIKTTQSNTTLPIINKTDFSKFNISIPCLEEQQKIADFLSIIDAKIESTNQQITKTQSFKKGLLQQMFV